MPKAIIFDMDGTMVDTEVMWGVVTAQLAENHGIVFDPAVRVRMMGKREKEALAVFKEFFKLDASVDELARERMAMVLANVEAVRVNPGLIELLDLLESLSIKKAVATSSFREFVDQVLGKFDLARRFDVILTAEDVARGKPDPMMFLEAARRLGVAPQDCLVLEDAQNGVEAAYNAGMKVFAIPHDASRHHDFSRATATLGSLREVGPLLATL